MRHRVSLVLIAAATTFIAHARARSLALAGLVALSSQGCTLVGAGIGAAIPSYEPQRVVNVMPNADICARIHAPRPAEDEDVCGRYEGRNGEAIVVVTSSGRREVPAATADEVRVRNGTCWLPFMLLGLAVDAVIVLAVVTAPPPSYSIGHL